VTGVPRYAAISTLLKVAKMKLELRVFSTLVAAGGLILMTGALSSGTAAAAGPPLCVGTPTAPGVLSGDYRSGVSIEGVCAVNAGVAVVHGTLNITPGSALVAAFALNDLRGKGASRLTVLGNVNVSKGATLILGCEPNHFACVDDPNAATGGTLTSRGVVRGNIDEDQPLGVVVHASTINGDVHENGGGGGITCAPPTTGIWAVIGSPVYSDYEDTAIHGNVAVSGLNTCWTGLARDGISGSLALRNNQLADADGIEVLANHVSGNLDCHANSNVWDSGEANPAQTGLYPRNAEPNNVEGTRSGQCVLASPATQGGPPGPGPF
jgi:hypothetical protein